MSKVKMISLSLIFICCNGFAGELANNAEITRIGTSSNGVTDDFFITLSGGTGPCTNRHVIFPASKSPSEGFYDRLYATALLAYSNGSKKVRVVNPTDDNCNTATYIELSK